VFTIGQHDAGWEWQAAHTEGLINHLRSCEWQPEAVCQRAEDHKFAAKSPRKSRHNYAHGDSSTAGPSTGPYSRPQAPLVYVQTPSDTYQSPYTLAVPHPLQMYTNMDFESTPQSAASSSGSGLAPSDSISVWSSSQPRSLLRSRSHT